MKPYQSRVVDDEALARELIESHIEKIDGFDLAASCGSAIEAGAIRKQRPIDLMFLDIEMPVLKGVEFYQRLSNRPKVIFTTAYRDYAVDGFELQAVDYLLKPITFSRFFQAIEHFQSLLLRPRNEPVLQACDKHIYIRENRKQVRLDLNKVLYIQRLKDYVQIYTEDGKNTAKCSMSAFLKQLDERFVRVHRSYIINTDKVSAISPHDIELGHIQIPIGERYREHLVQTVIS